MPLSNLAVRDIETVLHPYTNLAGFRETGPLVLERGKGVFVYDSDGKAYIEGMAGLWCTALGYGNEELVEAAATQMRKLSFAHLFTGKSHDPAIELAENGWPITPFAGLSPKTDRSLKPPKSRCRERPSQRSQSRVAYLSCTNRCRR